MKKKSIIFVLIIILFVIVLGTCFYFIFQNKPQSEILVYTSYSDQISCHVSICTFDRSGKCKTTYETAVSTQSPVAYEEIKGPNPIGVTNATLNQLTLTFERDTYNGLTKEEIIQKLEELKDPTLSYKLYSI